MPADDGEGNDRLIKRLYSSVMIVQTTQNHFFRNDNIVVLFCKAVCSSCEISTCWDIYSWWIARVTLQLIPPDWHASSNVRHQCCIPISSGVWGLQNETVWSANNRFSTLTGTHLVLLLSCSSPSPAPGQLFSLSLSCTSSILSLQGSAFSLTGVDVYCWREMLSSCGQKRHCRHSRKIQQNRKLWEWVSHNVY